MNNRFAIKLSVILLVLIMASSALFAGNTLENGISIYAGADGAAALSQSTEKLFFRSALRFDFKADIVNRTTGSFSYGPYAIFEVTTPSLTVNNTRNVGHMGFGIGYNLGHTFGNGMRLGGYVGYIYGSYFNTKIKYSAIDAGLEYLIPVADIVDVKTKAGISYRGSMYSGYLQVGCGLRFKEAR